MKRRIWRVVCLLLIVCLLVTQTSVIVFADEPEPPTGMETVYCLTTFSIVDSTGTYTNDIIVYLTNIANNEVTQILLTSDTDYTGNADNTTFGLVGNTTYEVEFNLPSDGDYEIVDIGGSRVQKFAATESGLALNWVLQTQSGRPHGEDEDITSNNTSQASTGSIKGGEVLQEFMRRTSFMAEDSNYADFMKNNSPQLYFSKFEEAMGGTQEEWEALSDYERFCIVKLYLMPYGFAASGDYSRYFKNVDTFLSHMAIDSGLNVLSIKGAAGTEEVHNAIREVWIYQYQHFQETGRMDNLFTEWQADKKAATGSIKLTETPQKTLSAQENRSNLSGATGLLDSLKGGIFAIVLAAAALGGMGYLMYQRKKSGIDDTDLED